MMLVVLSGEHRVGSVVIPLKPIAQLPATTADVQYGGATIEDVSFNHLRKRNALEGQCHVHIDVRTRGVEGDRSPWMDGMSSDHPSRGRSFQSSLSHNPYP